VKRDLVREWREQYARRGTQLGFHPSTDARFYSSVQAVLDEPRVVRATLSPGLLFRDQNMIRDGDDRLNLVVTQSSGYNVWHRRRELCLAQGDATMFQADAPGKSGSATGFSLMEICMPQTEWNARGVRAGDFLMRVVRRDSEGLRLLGDYLRSLEACGVSFITDARDVIRGHVIDLAVLATTRQQPIGESGMSAVMAARRAAVLEQIAKRFQDPELSVTTVANTLRISPRYVQRLLETLGTSFTAYVTELRLQQALKLLTESQRGVLRIADVALEAGFSDVSYFNRLFRSRFGDTPSDVRAQVLHKIRTYK
jgi:AraC-like DNA-binding protein